MRLVANQPFRFVRLHVWILEQPQAELVGEHPTDQLIEPRLSQRAVAHQLDQMVVAIGLGQLDVHAGPHGQQRRLPAIPGHVMPVQLWSLSQFADGVVVGHHIPFESPLTAQHVLQQPSARVRRHTVDLVVRRHHAHRAGRVDRLPERVQKRLTQKPLRHTYRRAIVARLGLAVGGEVFQRRDHVSLVAECAVTLESLHGRDPQPRHQVGVLAIRLLHATPARIAGHVYHRRERLVGAPHPGLGRRHDQTTCAPGPDRTSPPVRSAVESWWRPSPPGHANTPRGTPRGCPADSPRRRTSESRWSTRPSGGRSCHRRRRSAGPPAQCRSHAQSWPGPFSRSNSPASSNSSVSFCCQMQTICAAFSSSVIRPNRSATRWSIGNSGLRYPWSLVRSAVIAVLSSRKAQCCRRGNAAQHADQTRRHTSRGESRYRFSSATSITALNAGVGRQSRSNSSG